jgi:hypothetical protein
MKAWNIIFIHSKSKSMKKILFVLFILSACDNDPDEKAKAEVEAYIKKNITHPGAYESINFSPIESDSTTILDEPVYKAILDSIAYYNERQKSLANVKVTDGSNSHQQDYQKITDSINFLNSKSRHLLENYKGKPNGFKIVHVFGKQNKRGQKVLARVTFHLDSSYKLKNLDTHKESINRN